MDGQEEIICILDSCRLCLQRQGMYNVFKIEGLLRDIYEFLGIKIYFSGKLPQMICRECMDILYNIKQLKIIATNSDIHIRSYLHPTNEPYKIDSQMEQAIRQQNLDSTECPDTISTSEQIETIIKSEDLTIDEDSFLVGDISQNKEPYFNVLHEEDPCLGDDEPTHDTGPCSGDEAAEMPKIIVRSDLFTSAGDEPSTKVKSCLIEVPKLDVSTIKQEVKFKNENFKSEYKCDVCRKNFQTWKKLYLHSRIHNKSYPCTVQGCQKIFATRGDLVKHTRTHTGEKPFICDVCPRRFSQKVSLRHHRIAVHRLIPEVIVGT